MIAAEEIVSSVKGLQMMRDKFTSVGIISLKVVGSYLTDSMRLSRPVVDVIGVYETMSSDRTEEVKQVELIKCRVKEMFANTKELNKFSLESGHKENDNNSSPYQISLYYWLDNKIAVTVILFFQNVFSEESYVSLEHWKELSEKIVKFDPKQKALMRLLRMWR